MTTPMHADDGLAAAAEYINRGYRVVLLHGVGVDSTCTCAKGRACRHAGKHPVRKDWHTHGITDLEELNRQWRARGDTPTNIGILLLDQDRMLVIDVDVKKEKPGLQSLNDWEKRLGFSLDQHLAQCTPSGGRHYVLRVPATVETASLPNRSDVSPGIDVLRDQRQFVVSPSVVADGRQYGFPGMEGDLVLPPMADLPEAPPALIEHLQGLGSRPATNREPVKELESLKAPSVEDVRKAVACIPNGEDVDRSKYLWMAHRIRWACGSEFIDDGRDIFLQWAAQYPSADPVEDARVYDTLDPKDARGGWEDLWRLASKHGYDAAAEMQRVAQEAFVADEPSDAATAVEVAPCAPGTANAGGKGKIPVAQKLFREMLRDPSIKVFHSRRGKRPYAQIRYKDRWQTHSLDGASGIALLRHVLSQQRRPPSGKALAEAIELLKGHARYEAPAQDVYSRAARLADAVYIDLGDETYRAIEVTRTGWRIIDEPPVAFARSSTMLPLPEPESGGSVEDFREFLATESEQHLRLLLHWIVDVFVAPELGPRPVLVFDGPPGSGKTTMTEWVKALTDPQLGGVCAPPEKERDLVITARSNLVVAFDNTSKITWAMSDALCRLASGGGVRVRKLYTDEDETVFDERRPIIVNSIGDVAKQADLRDRCVFIPTGALTARRDDSDLRRAFERKRGRLLGLILDAVRAVLAGEATVDGPTTIRMAGFARRGMACASVFGWESGAFLGAYTANIEEAAASFVQDDLVARELRRVTWEYAREFRVGRLSQREYSDQEIEAAMQKWGDAVWSGPAADLLEYLDMYVRPEVRQRQAWPRDYRWFGRQLKLLAPALKRAGLEIENDRSSDERAIIIRDHRNGRRRTQELGAEFPLSVDEFL